MDRPKRMEDEDLEQARRDEAIDTITQEARRARESESELLQFVQFVNGYGADLPSDIMRRAAKLIMKAEGVE